MYRARGSLIALAASALLASCVTVDAALPPTLPRYEYDVPRELAAAIPEDRARTVLADVFALTTRMSTNRDPPVVEDEGFSFRMELEEGFGYEGYSFDFHFRFDEVTPVIVDMKPIGGRYGVKFQRDGVDVPYAYLMTQTLSDAETIVDALAALRGVH